MLAILAEVNRELRETASLEQLDRKLDARIWDRNWRPAIERLEKKAEAGDLRGLVERVVKAEEVSGGVWGG